MQDTCFVVWCGVVCCAVVCCVVSCLVCQDADSIRNMGVTDKDMRWLPFIAAATPADEIPRAAGREGLLYCASLNPIAAAAMEYLVEKVRHQSVQSVSPGQKCIVRRKVFACRPPSADQCNSVAILSVLFCFLFDSTVLRALCHVGTIALGVSTTPTRASETRCRWTLLG